MVKSHIILKEYLNMYLGFRERFHRLKNCIVGFYWMMVYVNIRQIISLFCFITIRFGLDALYSFKIILKTLKVK